MSKRKRGSLPGQEAVQTATSSVAAAEAWPGLRELLAKNGDWKMLVHHDQGLRSMYEAPAGFLATEEGYFSWAQDCAASCASAVRKIAEDNNIPWPFAARGSVEESELGATTAEAVALWWLFYKETGIAHLGSTSDAPTHPQLLKVVRKLASPSDMPTEQQQQQQTTEPDRLGQRLAEHAFELGERVNAKGKLPSLGLYERLCECVEDYRLGGYLAPYTSLVGPSGMGKSFAVKQLAVGHGLYVSYASLARPDAKAVPGRSALAWTMQSFPDADKNYRFWQIYLGVCTALIEASQHCNVTPAGHFHMQYHSACAKTQQALASLVAQEMVSERLKSSHRVLVHRLRKVVQEALPVLEEHGWNTPPAHGTTSRASRGKQQPLTVICIDEATGLFSATDRDESGRYRPSVSFRNFRSALRSFSESKTTMDGIIGLLLDTSSHITNFAPPASADTSQKYPHSYRLLRPIYYLDTWDVFASSPSGEGDELSWLDMARCRDGHSGSDDNDDENFLANGPDGSLRYQMFTATFGRPLWASAVAAAKYAPNSSAAESGQEQDEEDRTQNALLHVRQLAHNKLTGTAPDHSIALLLHRLQFHVQNHRLAEDLVAKWMHFFLYVPKDRTWVSTGQPSEPVLALAAAQKLLDPKTRCQVLRDFVQMQLYGVLHAGDCGEIVPSLLLLFAADAHLCPSQPTTVTLPAFLTTLFGRVGDDSDGDNDGNDDSNDDDKDWAGGEVFLTHFSRLRLRHGQSLTAKRLISAFVLGQGIILPQGMAGADLLVPVWLRAEQRMGALLVQVKNRANGTLGKAMCSHARASMEMAQDALPFLKKTRVFGMYLSLRGTPGKGGSPRAWLPPRSGRLPIVVAAGFGSSVFSVLRGTPRKNASGSTQTEDDMEPILQKLLDNVGQVIIPDDRIEGVDSILYTRDI